MGCASLRLIRGGLQNKDNQGVRGGGDGSLPKPSDAQASLVSEVNLLWGVGDGKHKGFRMYLSWRPSGVFIGKRRGVFWETEGCTPQLEFVMAHNLPD